MAKPPEFEGTHKANLKYHYDGSAEWTLEASSGQRKREGAHVSWNKQLRFK